MPYLKTVNRTTFSVNQKTQLIISLFKKACDMYFKSKTKEEHQITDLVIGEMELKKGMIPWIVSGVENLFEKKYGAKFVTLNAIENLKLDPKADMMLTGYTREIDSIFKRHGMTSADLNKEEDIDSAALVFRALLLRLVTIALSTDSGTSARDGEVLLKIYTYFVDLVLCNMDEFKDEDDIFGYFASREHVEWMNSVAEVVFAVKLIHSHQDSITECLTTLKSLTRNIECMILAYLTLADSKMWPIDLHLPFTDKTPKIITEDLKDQSIELKLNEFEEYLRQKNQNRGLGNLNDIIRATGITTFAAIERLGYKSEAKSLIDARDIYDNSQIAALLACRNNKCPDDIYEKLLSLYSLYFKTRCLLISLEQIDELITTCSWVPIVMGTINLSRICYLMRKHCDMCASILSIPNNDLITTLPFKQAIMQKSFHSQAQLKDMYEKIRALENLQNPVVIKKIKYQVAGNIMNLLEIQSALEISLLQYAPQKARDGGLSSALVIEELGTGDSEEKTSPRLLTQEPSASFLKLFSFSNDTAREQARQKQQRPQATMPAFTLAQPQSPSARH